MSKTNLEKIEDDVVLNAALKKKRPISGATPAIYSQGDYVRQIPVKNNNGDRSEFRRDYARLIHSPAFRRLQGKTQLFPGGESDFFRNRLTHSQEVAQVAKTIAQRINLSDPFFKKAGNHIDTDLVEMAALAHDLGHPPFGHNGEEALDECMRDFGGFEGNAQTLRIVTRLEKKEKNDGDSEKVGLNLSFRAIAAILKYDRVIPIEAINREHSNQLVKGYYKSEEALVSKVKKSILNGEKFKGKFKTIECSIMDIADDIAYSTYDLEDAFKAGFVDPLEILQYANDERFLSKISNKVSASLEVDVSDRAVKEILYSSFGWLMLAAFKDEPAVTDEGIIEGISRAYSASKALASDGYLRTAFTSALVNEFVCGVSVKLNKELPALSTIKVDLDVLKKIEVLKRFTFEAMIMSPRLKIVEHRGKDIVKELFENLAGANGHLLLPPDFRLAYLDLDQMEHKKRLICDFIAGMTDRYAVEFYRKLLSVGNANGFFKPF